MDLSNILITTARLKLIPISGEYASEIFKEFTKEITTYMFPQPPKEIKDTIAYIHSVLPKIKSGEELSMIILARDTKEFLGVIGVHNLNTKTPYFGIWIKKSAHGNRYGQEAIKGLKKWIDEKVVYDYLIYPVDKNNIPSRKIPESLGGIISCTYEKKSVSGKILDIVEYWIYKK